MVISPAITRQVRSAPTRAATTRAAALPPADARQARDPRRCRRPLSLGVRCVRSLGQVPAISSLSGGQAPWPRLLLVVASPGGWESHPQSTGGRVGHRTSGVRSGCTPNTARWRCASACRRVGRTPTRWRRSPATWGSAWRPSCERWPITAGRWWRTLDVWMGLPRWGWTRPASSRPLAPHQLDGSPAWWTWRVAGCWMRWPTAPGER